MSTNDHIHSFRLPTSEFRALVNAAKESGETLSEFIRNAVAQRITPPKPSTLQVNSVYGPPEFQFSDCVTWTRNSAAHSDIAVTRTL